MTLGTRRRFLRKPLCRRWPTPSVIKDAVRQRDGFRCTECGMTDAKHREKTGRGLEVHRLIPGSRYTFSGCVTLCRCCHGPKPRSDRGGSFRVGPELWRKIRVTAAWLGLRPKQYLLSVLLTGIEEDYARMLHEAADKDSAPPS